MTPLRFGDTSRVSLNENPCDAAEVEVLLVSSGVGSGVGGGGDGGVHKGSSGLAVQSKKLLLKGMYEIRTYCLRQSCMWQKILH
jgi:hypothetical protein